MKVVEWTQLSVNATQALDAALPVLLSRRDAKKDSNSDDDKDRMDLLVLLTSAKALNYDVGFNKLLQSEGSILEPLDPSVLASHTTAVTDAHMEGLLKRYTIQSS
jgi:hypothetical protein